MIDFGAIFRYKEDMYVYLMQSGDLTFAAKILDKSQTDLLIRLRERDLKKKQLDRPMYSFVVLSTEDLEDRAAHYGNPMLPNDCSPEIIKKLSSEDIDALRIEIMNDEAANILLRNVITKLSKKR